MSRSFDIKLDKISESYQTFNNCAVGPIGEGIYESSKISADNF